MRLLKTYQWSLIGAVVGAVGGFLYWKEIGCVTGTCPLKSQWQTMVPYGTLVGFVGADLLKDFYSKFQKRNGNETDLS
ncbi:MAG: DUF6132 family protein [Spirosomataceae bacterium]